MKKPILLIFGFAVSFCFGFLFKTIITKDPVINVNVEQKTDNSIVMKKVTGIAGIFFKCKDPEKIKAWYKTHLGFATDQYGACFEWQEGYADGFDHLRPTHVSPSNNLIVSRL